MNYISRLKALGSITLKILAATGIFTLLFISSCDEDPTFLGRDLLPPTDDLSAKYTEDILIETNITKGDPLITSVTPVFLLGSYIDPNFGISKADFMTKLAISDTTIPENIFIDSMIFNLEVDGFFGDTLSTQTLRIFEMTQGLSNDTIHYSNTLPDGKYNPQELASIQISPADTILEIRIVNSDFFRQFEEVHDSVYADPNDFYNFFEGFYVTTENTGNPGAIFYIDLTSAITGLNMYYRESAGGEVMETEMIIAEFTPRVNTFYHNYEGSLVSQFFDRNIPEDTALFVSAMGGVDTKITFPEIEEWINKKPIAINKAELYIPVEDSLFNGLSESDYPSSLSLQTYNQDGKLTYLYDYRIDNDSKSYFGGKYDNNENAYVFNIGVHLQSYIEGDVSNMDLVLKAGQNSISANRVIMKGPDAANRKVQLKITYTEF